MATIFNRGDGIITCAATETQTFEKAEHITHIVLTGTAAGTFVLIIGNTTLTVTTGADNLTLVIPIGRAVNYIKLTSGPTAAGLFAFLRKA